MLHPAYGCTNTRIKVFLLTLGFCQAGAEVAALQWGITKVSSDPHSLLFETCFILVVHTARNEKSIWVWILGHFTSLCLWPQKPAYTNPISQRGRVLSTEKVSLPRILLLVYFESLGNPGQLRSNAMRKQAECRCFGVIGDTYIIGLPEWVISQLDMSKRCRYPQATVQRLG